MARASTFQELAHFALGTLISTVVISNNMVILHPTPPSMLSYCRDSSAFEMEINYYPENSQSEQEILAQKQNKNALILIIS